DARHDGAIVAAQLVAGASRLVLLRTPHAALRTEPSVTPITSTTLDTLWSEPRWSNAGDRVVAVRWCRGGVSQIVVIDTLGRVLHVAASGRFTAAAPSWLPGDSGVVYTIGDDSRNDVYVQRFRSPGYEATTYRVFRMDLGAFEPQIRPGHAFQFAGVSLRANGYRLGVTDSSRPPSLQAVTAPFDTQPDPRLPALAVDSTRAQEFSALSSVYPRYWVPLFESDNDADRIGGYTEGWDILRRHYVYGELLFPLREAGINAAAQYTYRGIGEPILTFSASQTWSTYAHIRPNANSPILLAELQRRVHDGSVLATFLRQRFRTAFSVSLGAGFERRSYVTVPDSFMRRIDSVGLYAPSTFPRLTIGSSFAAYRSPAMSISPEDGVTLAATARDRFASGFTGRGGQTMTVVGSTTAYKSLDLPGFAHHVLAVRGAVGWSDTRAPGYLEVGGVSGGTFEVIPGYTIGEGRQTFPVRGFLPASTYGTQAFSGSAEYRAPLSISHRTLGILPAFVNRTSLTLFGDYGVAWCPSSAPANSRQVCTDPALTERFAIASVGAELNLNAGVLSWDSPYRFRFGIVHPVLNGASSGAKAISVYLTSGLSF
ncbi:MAG TPA: hypothetical protein VIV65_06030, partial [Gemmatimonadaceae bacterium]